MNIKLEPGSAQTKDLADLQVRLEAVECLIHSSAYQPVWRSLKLLRKLAAGQEVDRAALSEAASALLEIAPTVRTTAETAIRKTADGFQKLLAQESKCDKT